MYVFYPQYLSGMVCDICIYVLRILNKIILEVFRFCPNDGGVRLFSLILDPNV